MNIIYLVGQICGEKETYEWRRRFANHFRMDKERFEILDPCACDFSQSAIEIYEKHLVSFGKYVSRSKHSNLLVPRDKSFVDYSDICVVNLNHYCLETPMIGSFFELAWYFENPEKPVIAIYDGDPKENYICNHPFVKQTVHTWTQDVSECVYVIKNFF